jgi:hypothetical protein
MNALLKGLFAGEPAPTQKGLLGDVLPWVYSKGNALRGLLSNPVESAQNAVADANTRAGGLLDLTRQATNEGMAYGPATNALAGLLGDSFNPAGMAALVKPLGTGAHYAVPSLDEYTSRLYRETSIDRATEFLPNSASHPQTLWFSNEPAYALGQGANKGVLMEFDAKGIPGQLSLQKPMARQQYEAGNAEFIAKDASASQIGQNLQSIRISPEQQRGPYFRRIQGLLKDWKVSKEADGSLVFTK